MDLNLLKVFIAVANNKSISLGAKELGFSQSNVTHRIKQLEKTLEYELFYRTNKGVGLSLEGQKFYPYAIEIIKKFEEATLKMKNISYQEHLKVGSTQSNSTIRLTQFLQKIKKDYAEINLEFTVDSSLNLIDLLLDYKLDIAFVNGKPEHKDIEVLNIFPEEIVLIEPKNKKAEKTIFAYKNGCLNRIFLEKYLLQNTTNTYKKVNLENYELIMACVKEAMGVAIFSKKVVEKFGYIDKLKLTNMDFALDTHLICRKDYLPMIEDYLRQIKLP